MGTTAEIKLGEKLSKAYNESPHGYTVTTIHLFGIKYAQEIKDSKSKVAEIIKYAKIHESYKTELSKGIKLSKYVVLK